MAPAKTKPVPETVLKKRRRADEWTAKRAADAVEAKKKAKASRKDIFKRAESYVKEYRQQVFIQLLPLASSASCQRRRHKLQD